MCVEIVTVWVEIVTACVCVCVCVCVRVCVCVWGGGGKFIHSDRRQFFSRIVHGMGDGGRGGETGE